RILSSHPSPPSLLTALPLHDALPIWITLHAGVRVTAVDRHAKLVRGDEHVFERYDVLVFATGSSAFVPPIKGLNAHGRGSEMKEDRKSTRLNSSHLGISYAVFCLKKK